MTNIFKIAVAGMCLLSSTLEINAQSRFVTTIGGTGNDRGNSAIQISSGDFIIAGYTTISGNQNALLSKVSSTGTIMWSKNYGGSAADEFRDVKATSDGGFIAVGSSLSYTSTYSSPYQSSFIVKTDAAGNTVWSKVINAQQFRNDFAGNVVQTSDGGYLVQCAAFVGSQFKTYVIKLNATGGLVYIRLDDTANTIPGELLPLSDGTYMSATASYAGTLYDLCITKHNADGTFQWTSLFGTSNNDGARGIDALSNGYLLTGNRNSDNGGAGYEACVVRTDASGTRLWGGSLIKAGRPRLQAFASEVGSSTPLVNTYTTLFADETTASHDIYLARYSETSMTWSKKFGGVGNDHATSLRTCSDGGFVIVGFTNGSGAGGEDILLIKTDNQGNTGSCFQSEGGITLQQNADVTRTRTLTTSGVNSSANVTTTGTSVTLTKNNVSGILDVSIAALPKDGCGRDIQIFLGYKPTEQLSGSASNGTTPYTYSWTNGSTLSSSTIANPVASPTSTTSYTLTMTDPNGCTGSATTTVNVLDVRCNLSTPAISLPDGVKLCTQIAGGTPMDNCVPVGEVAGRLQASAPPALKVCLGACDRFNGIAVQDPTLLESATTGIAQNTGMKYFSFYPNPAGSKLYLLGDVEAGSKLTVYDISGSKILDQTINSKEIELSSLQNGIYMFVVTTASGISEPHRVQVIH